MVAVAVAAAWYDLARARAELGDARASLVAVAADPGSLRTGAGRTAARERTDEARRRIAGAGRRLERSLPLRVAGAVPGLSAQRRGALALVDDARSGAGVAADLLAAVDDLAGRAQVAGGSVPLGALERMQSHLDTASTELAAVRRPAARLWGPLGRARRELDRVAGETARRLGEAADAMGAAGRFLGADGPRRYVVAVQNNAEMRAQGMVLSYAFLRASGGRLDVERSGPIADLVLDRPIGLAVPEGTARVFGGLAPDRLWQSVNATADFAWSGRAMAAMAAQATGQPVDGVIALDVVGLAAVLRVVGPVAVDGIPGPLDAANAADVLLNRLYADFPRLPEQAERKERLGAVAEALVGQLGARAVDAVQLGSELAGAAAGGHLRLWSADPDEEAVFERSGLGGGPGLRAPERTIHVSVQNATAAKLDYFVRPRVDLRVSLTPEGAAVVQAEVVVANQSPPTAPDSYQFGPDGAFQERAGQYITRVYFWGPRGAEQEGSVEESGLRLSQGPTTVEPAAEGSVHFQTVVPDAVREGRLELRLVPQPRLFPPGLRVRLDAPGWEVEGPTSLEPVWDRPVTVSWRVRR